jgi:hypothetical protein
MTPTTRIRRNTEILAADVAEETVLLDPGDWTYVFLNETAARIWEALDEPRSVGEVVEVLERTYDVDRATCDREVSEFVGEMSARGVLLVEPAA